MRRRHSTGPRRIRALGWRADESRAAGRGWRPGAHAFRDEAGIEVGGFVDDRGGTRYNVCLGSPVARGGRPIFLLAGGAENGRSRR